MPTYEHLCSACDSEFEDIYSINADPPTTCPLCNVEGKVKRLISGTAKGIVELGPQELQAHILSERVRIKKEFNKNENLRANIIGEAKYNQIESFKDKYGR